jgi:methylamine dehydrogenase accessory protein MauD
LNDALLVSNALLWVAVALLAALVLALVRQIGVLHERIAPAGALLFADGPRVGDAAPIHTLPELAGGIRTIGGPSPTGRSTLLFFLSPSCPVCKALLPVLDALSGSEAEWLDVVLASDGPREEHERFSAREGLGRFPYLLGAELGIAYRVGKLPFAVLLDDGGVLRAKGLVNTREHVESLLEAKEQGVASIQDYLAGRRAGGGAGAR